MKFYVNKIMDTLDNLKPLNYEEGEYFVGLFSDCETVGEGSFGGYHASESYLDVNLYACCVYKGAYLKQKVGNIIDVNKHYNKIHIATHMWTQVIEAKTLTEAKEKFKNSEWRQWNSEIDEFSNESTIT